MSDAEVQAARKVAIAEKDALAIVHRRIDRLYRLHAESEARQEKRLDELAAIIGAPQRRDHSGDNLPHLPTGESKDFH